jgi:ribosomal protein L11 methyltransferase
MNTIWAEVTCLVPTAMADMLSEFLVKLSGNGVTIENRSVDTFSIDSIEETPEKLVTAYLLKDDSLDEKLAEINLRHGQWTRFPRIYRLISANFPYG